MAARRKKTADEKEATLRSQGTLNPRPGDVRDSVFVVSNFFDPRDLVQVKYEMLRRVRTGDCSVTEAASRFGLSRPTFYAAKADFERHGLGGLLPRKRGPRGPHKLTDEVMTFLEDELASESTLDSDELASRIEDRFGCRVHPRSVERGLQRWKKNNS